MSRIKDAIKKGTGKVPVSNENDKVKLYVLCSGLNRRISMANFSAYVSYVIKITVIPFTNWAIVRDIWFYHTTFHHGHYLVRNQFRPSTLDDIEKLVEDMLKKLG